MGFVEQYILQIGEQTGNAMKRIMFHMLSERYYDNCSKIKDKYGINLDTTKITDMDFSAALAASVANFMFCEEPSELTLTEFQDFAKKYEELFYACIKELSKEEAFCRAITCAVYNFCYAKYVASGRKVGFLFHPYIGFVRALNVFISKETGDITTLQRFYEKVGYENVKPLLNLCQYELYRLLPNTPDSKRMINEVVGFGKSIGYSF